MLLHIAAAKVLVVGILLGEAEHKIPVFIVSHENII